MKYLGSVLISVLASSLVQAAPQKYNNCDITKKIQSPADAQGFYMNESCDKAYVLPPVRGSIEVAGYIPTFSSADCSNLENYEDEVESLKKRISSVREQEELAFAENESYRSLRKSCSNKKIQFKKVSQEFENLQQNLEDKNAELQKVKEQLKTCETATGTMATLCGMWQISAQTLPLEIMGLEMEVQAVSSKLKKSKNKNELCQNKLVLQREIMEQEGNEFTEQRISLQRQLASALTQLRSYRDIVKSEAGAQVGIQLFSDQEVLRKAYQDLNASLGIEFVNMPITKGLLSLEFVVNGDEANAPVLLRSKINGIVDNQNLPLALEELGKSRVQVNSIIGQAIAGELELNTYGACKLHQEAKRTGKTETEVMAGLITPSAHFSYPVQVTRVLDIKYNEKHLYQLIKKHTNKKSGLFKSKSVRSVTEKSTANKWIRVKVASEDANHQFVDTQKIISDIRSEFVDAALMRVARSYTTASPLPISSAGPNAASDASAVLKKCPNFYCQAASFALDLGSALFGGSTSESRMTRIVEASESQRYTDTKAISGYAAQVYSYRESK